MISSVVQQRKTSATVRNARVISASSSTYRMTKSYLKFIIKMLFFQSSRPRRFHHEYMFVDERKELLNDIEQRARCEVDGKEVSERQYREELQRKLGDSLKPQVLRHRRNRFTAMWVSLILSAGVIALLILFLFIAL